VEDGKWEVKIKTNDPEMIVIINHTAHNYSSENNKFKIKTVIFPKSMSTENIV
jgi:hypothetical protein